MSTPVSDIYIFRTVDAQLLIILIANVFANIIPFIYICMYTLTILFLLLISTQINEYQYFLYLLLNDSIAIYFNCTSIRSM